MWLLSSSPEISPGTELAGHLRRLLAILEPPLGSRGNWSKSATKRPGTAGSPPTPQNTPPNSTGPTLQRLLALPDDLWLDVCGDEIGTEHCNGTCGSVQILETKARAYSGSIWRSGAARRAPRWDHTQ